MQDHFDGWVAEHYDETSAEMFEPALLERTVDFLAARSTGDALELAIGTGRVALPLATRGLHVEGIELSPAMAAQLRAKPGGDAIPVAIGDMATTRLGRTFSLVYVVWNSIGNLTTQDAQVACFQNAAEHLVPGGRFVVELWVPDIHRLMPGEDRHLVEMTPEHVGIDVVDVVTQVGTSHHWFTTADGATRHVTTPWRYAWPSELDLMARLAGLVPAERWADWDGAPFTAASRRHVSVWTKPA